MLEHNYLVNMPQSAQEYGFSKVLLVRREFIHIKHIFTEVFTRKSIDAEKELSKIGWTIMDWMEFMTHRMRHISKFNRTYEVSDINKINGVGRNHFFPFYDLVKPLNSVIVLDFDGVCTKKSFWQLYQLCKQRANKLHICSANPTVNKEWFVKNGLDQPNRIFACKGKQKKINQLIRLQEIYDFVFFIDNEKEYLDYAWLFGIQTFIYQNGKIVYYTRKTK